MSALLYLLKSKYKEAVAEARRLQARLAHHGNAHSPPPPKSLEWKEALRARRKARKVAPEGGGGRAPAGRPGGQPGHRGASCGHTPGCTACHGFEGDTLRRVLRGKARRREASDPHAHLIAAMRLDRLAAVWKKLIPHRSIIYRT